MNNESTLDTRKKSEESLPSVKPNELVFVMVDFWNRPVFRRGNTKHLYGSVNVLCDYGDTAEEVLSKVSLEDLCYFGTDIEDDPLGTPIHESLGFAPLERQPA